MTATPSMSGKGSRIVPTGGPLALATLVAATGSTPKRSGAKMWLDAKGNVTGTVTIGGCVDARVLDAAARALDGAPASLLDLDLANEEAWELGLTCGGAVKVFVERVDDDVRDVYRTVDEALARGRAVVLATTLEASPRRVVFVEGATGDRAGPTAFDDEIRAAAADVFGGGVSVMKTVGAGDNRVDVFFELLAPPIQLVIIGAGEVARTLVAIAHELGMESVVVDARERFASRERFPQATQLRVGIPSEIVGALPRSRRVAIVLVAHDYKYELPILRDVLRSDVGYIGMLGGKRRGATLRQMLAEEGFTADELARIHSPIGVDIGASSTAEIALSIVAEVVALGSSRARRA